MATSKDFQVDRRVAIALDAMTASQKATIEPLLHDKQRFLAHASRPGASRKLSTTKPLYAMRAGAGLRVIYSRKDGDVVVLDIMRTMTIDPFLSGKRKRKTPSVKKIATT